MKELLNTLETLPCGKILVPALLAGALVGVVCFIHHVSKTINDALDNYDDYDPYN